MPHLERAGSSQRRIVQFKLEKLEQHLKTSSRLLNDLRSLRRLLLDERLEPSASREDPAA